MRSDLTVVLAGGERVLYIGVDTPDATGSPQFFGPKTPVRLVLFRPTEGGQGSGQGHVEPVE